MGFVLSKAEEAEIDDISRALSEEDDWAIHGEQNVNQSIVALCATYPRFIDVQIKKSQAYGCEIRTRAFANMTLAYGALFPNRTERSSDILLCTRLALWQANVPGATDNENTCFGRVRLLAEAHVNARGIEEKHLKENPELRYLEGVLPYTSGCHEMLTQLRKEMKIK